MLLTGLGLAPASLLLKTLPPQIEQLTAPVNLALPTISGERQEGETLTASQGVWDSGGAAITLFSFQWFRSGNPIPAATTPTYTPTVDDVAAELRVEVAAQNSVGTTAVFSDPTGVIQPADTAPVNTALPTVSGVARSGENLIVASNGEWTGNGDELLDFTYQWLADDVPMPGKTGTLLALTDNEIGQRISLDVGAENSIGITHAVSLKTAAVVAPLSYPGIVTAPVISGTVKVPNVLTVSTGTWNAGNGTISGYTYQWFGDDLELVGETTNQLALAIAHEFQVIRAEVTATNEFGSITATSEPTAPVEPEVIAPVNTTQPVITGVTKAGEDLTCSQGDWYDGGEAPVYAFQWFRISDGLAIGGATNSVYTPVEEDIGDRVRCQVSATNSAGTTQIFSAFTTLIAVPNAPTNTVRPAITFDNLYVGTLLTASQGTWDTHTFDATYAYQWRADGVDIVGATGTTYTLTEDELGKRMSVAVASSTIGGTTTAISLQTAQVSLTPLPPTNTVLPGITGDAFIEATLTVVPGTWEDNGFVISGYTYQWRANAVNIPGATASTFVVTEAQDGLTITVVETAVNSVGGTPAESAAFGPINGYEPLPPENLTLPVVTGVFVAEGVQLTVSDGTWDDNHFAIGSYTYRWLADAVVIVGATSNTFTPTAAEIGAQITAEVSAVNAHGSTPATSLPVGPVGVAPIAITSIFDYAILEPEEFVKTIVFDYAILN